MSPFLPPSFQQPPSAQPGGIAGFQPLQPGDVDPYRSQDYYRPDLAMSDIQGMYQGAGITGPADAYDAMRQAYMGDMTSALNAAAAGGVRGGVGTAMGQDALRRSGAMQGLAGLAGQQAQAQTGWDAMLGGQALSYGQDRSVFGEGQRQFAAQHDLARAGLLDQSAQFGSQFDLGRGGLELDAARTAYEAGLGAWEPMVAAAIETLPKDERQAMIRDWMAAYEQPVAPAPTATQQFQYPGANWSETPVWITG